MFYQTPTSSPLCRPKEKYAAAFFLNFLAACALFVPFIIENNGYFLFYGDFDVQQVPFYKLAHEAVRSGNVFWDFGTDLGANFIGSYSFYLLGSPFFWLTLPFPTDFVPHLMAPLLILKFSCAGLSAYAYLTRFIQNKDYALLGSILYAFSGFSVYNIFFNHFHEAIIYFPLLLLGFEQVMRKEKYGLFIAAVALSAISNYYFFFGMVIFTVLYFIIRVMSGDWDLFTREETIKRDFIRLGLLCLSAILGLLLSCVLLLPAILAITGNTRIDSYLTGWNGIVYSRSQIYAYIFQCFFFPPDMPARPVFFPDANVKWSSVAGWLPVFSMTGVIAFMAAHKKSWQRKLIIASMVMALVPILNSIYSAFNYSYYARWFYMPILIMVLMTAKGLEDKKVNWNKGWQITAIITILFILVVGFFPNGQYEDGTISRFGLYTKDYQERFIVTCSFAIIGLLLMLLLIYLKKHSPKHFAKCAISLVLVLAVVYSSYCVGLGQKSAYDAKGFIIPTLLENNRTVHLENAYHQVENTYDIDDLRIDVYEGMDNIGMFLGIGSVHAFHSVVPGSIMEFYDYVGVDRTVATRAKPENYGLRGLLSVKYVLDYAKDDKNFEDENGATEIPGFSVYTAGELVENPDKKDFIQNDYYIYQNDYFVPYGFTYDYYITQEQMDQLEETQRDDMMLKAMLLTPEQIQKYGHLLTDIATDQIDYQDVIGQEFYYRNCLDRAATACSNFQTHQKGFTATTTLSKDNLVFFSVPYDAGWSATVDGKPVTIEKVNAGFMAVEVKGDGKEHEIRFEYTTPGLSAGLLISGVALLLTAVFLWCVKRFRKVDSQLVALMDATYFPQEKTIADPQPLYEEFLLEDFTFPSQNEEE